MEVKIWKERTWMYKVGFREKDVVDSSSLQGKHRKVASIDESLEVFANSSTCEQPLANNIMTKAFWYFRYFHITE